MSPRVVGKIFIKAGEFFKRFYRCTSMDAPFRAAARTESFAPVFFKAAAFFTDDLPVIP